MNEEWKDIIQLNGDYQISNFGQIKRVNPCTSRGCAKQCRHLNTMIKLETHIKGYKVFRLKHRKIRFRVHRLVADAFLSNPNNKLEVNHKDGNPENNHVDNLEWVTSEENNRWNDYLTFHRVLTNLSLEPSLAEKLRSDAYSILAPTGRV